MPKSETRRLIVSTLLVAVIGLSCIVGFGGCPRPQAAPRSALMVYVDYQPDLQPLGDYLQAHDLSVTYCNIATLPTSYKDYGVIVLGPDARDATADQATALNASGKPMLAIGDGGYDFFGLLGLEVGHPHGGHGSSGGAISTVAVTSSVFKSPNDFNVAAGDTITLYDANHQPAYVGIYLLGIPASANVKTLGTLQGFSNYSPFIVQDDRYLLWGFYDLDYLTDDGLKLLDNAVEYLLK